MKKTLSILFALLISCVPSDFSLEHELAGDGKPIVLMFSGWPDSMDTFDGVFGQVAQNTTVVRYNRSGYGESATPLFPTRSLDAQVAELSIALERDDITGPFVLVGHSYGGTLAARFAQLRPHDVAGLVLIEGRHPNATARCPEFGLPAVGPCSEEPPAGTPQPQASELTDLGDSTARMNTLPYPLAPTIVLTAAVVPPPFDTWWETSQADWLADMPWAEQRVVEGASHYIHLDRPGAVTEAIADVVSDARHGSAP